MKQNYIVFSKYQILWFIKCIEHPLLLLQNNTCIMSNPKKANSCILGVAALPKMHEHR